MSRLHNIIKIARKVHEKNERLGLNTGNNVPGDVIVIEALVQLAGLIDSYIYAQGDHVGRETAYRAMFEAVRRPTEEP